jgi:SEC-C motif
MICRLGRNGYILEQRKMPVVSHETLVRFLPDGPQPEAAVALAVFWSRSEHQAMIARWPRLTALLGATWDECRQRTERYCVLVDNNGFRVRQLPGDAGEFETFLAATGVAEPSEEDLLAYPDLRTVDASSMTSWPPERNALCWCCSGAKYKRCCRPRGLDATLQDRR